MMSEYGQYTKLHIILPQAKPHSVKSAVPYGHYQTNLYYRSIIVNCQFKWK